LQRVRWRQGWIHLPNKQRRSGCAKRHGQQAENGPGKQSSGRRFDPNKLVCVPMSAASKCISFGYSQDDWSALSTRGDRHCEAHTTTQVGTDSIRSLMLARWSHSGEHSLVHSRQSRDQADGTCLHIHTRSVVTHNAAQERLNNKQRIANRRTQKSGAMPHRLCTGCTGCPQTRCAASATSAASWEPLGSRRGSGSPERERSCGALQGMDGGRWVWKTPRHAGRTDATAQQTHTYSINQGTQTLSHQRFSACGC
jgi:hypothetical protein